ncbi:unnamed protein product [Gongylonema pulchrum]|uniref:CHCH domain-containing protein n=1 Tax=Gongylonema pulchrum TaxID=637853 RepID=A0A183DET5_9BILA|nr:unnamed protein product [Gongylonema pulchrum]
MPFVIPPSVPGGFRSSRARDQPIPDDDDDLPSRPTSGLEDCPPGCVEGPGCTDACKCKNTFRTVHEMCNPPADAEVAKHCSAWYKQCPMYKPVHF